MADESQNGRLHVCLEATGGWSEEVAIVLSEAGHIVSLVNPAGIKAFAQSEMLRTKTDAIDAALIARFCRLHEPQPWVPSPPEIRILQGLVRRQQSLIEMRVAEENRRDAPLVSPSVMASIDAMLEQIDREIDRVAQAHYARLRGPQIGSALRSGVSSRLRLTTPDISYERPAETRSADRVEHGLPRPRAKKRLTCDTVSSNLRGAALPDSICACASAESALCRCRKSTCDD